MHKEDECRVGRREAQEDGGSLGLGHRPEAAAAALFLLLQGFKAPLSLSHCLAALFRGQNTFLLQVPLCPAHVGLSGVPAGADREKERGGGEEEGGEVGGRVRGTQVE